MYLDLTPEMWTRPIVQASLLDILYGTLAFGDGVPALVHLSECAGPQQLSFDEAVCGILPLNAWGRDFPGGIVKGWRHLGHCLCCPEDEMRPNVGSSDG